jgi:hypothetical protein
MDKKKSILLRINNNLWNELNRWAQDELRSLNGQIEYILREEVRKRKRRRRASKDEL